MHYLALATDYDGTLTRDGVVDAATIGALRRLRASGRQLILVTGRQLDDLLRVFPDVALFDRVVAENGAVLYRPDTKEAQTLGEAPPPAFVETLHRRGVEPLSMGRVIVATWTPHETALLDTIRDLGLEHQVIFNKGAVMVLPPGVNKASGLHAALQELRLSEHNVVAVGDAENDHAFLSACECSAAVANALPFVKERADLVLDRDHGAGVAELIDQLLKDDLAEVDPLLERRSILLGTRASGQEVRLAPHSGGLLIAGPSGGGKSTMMIGILERLAEQVYQFCLVDPEGDYAEIENGTVVGDSQRPPSLQEVFQLLDRPDQQVVVNLLGIQLTDRPAFFGSLLTRLLDLRTKKGRPHWIVADEAHHLLPASGYPAAQTLPQETGGIALLTVHPERVAPAALALVDIVVALGDTAAKTLNDFAGALGIERPGGGQVTLEAGEALVWVRHAQEPPFRMRAAPSRADRRRHVRKYAEGELGEDKSFYFRGPEGRLNLRAQNLQLFAQIAEGLDDATWDYHRRQGDYSRWFRAAIKDEELAADAEAVERDQSLSAAESRQRIRAAIERRYTLPA
jgi:HAD superfamily hydrolase (TIGR01484 family)